MDLQRADTGQVNLTATGPVTITAVYRLAPAPSGTTVRAESRFAAAGRSRDGCSLGQQRQGSPTVGSDSRSGGSRAEAERLAATPSTPEQRRAA